MLSRIADMCPKKAEGIILDVDVLAVLFGKIQC
jgi:hypothetical protein